MRKGCAVRTAYDWVKLDPLQTAKKALKMQFGWAKELPSSAGILRRRLGRWLFHFPNGRTRRRRRRRGVTPSRNASFCV